MGCCLSRGPTWGPGLQPRHAPSLGIELATLWFAARTQSTELHQAGLKMHIFYLISILIHILSNYNRWTQDGF